MIFYIFSNNQQFVCKKLEIQITFVKIPFCVGCKFSSQDCRIHLDKFNFGFTSQFEVRIKYIFLYVDSFFFFRNTVIWRLVHLCVIVRQMSLQCRQIYIYVCTWCFKSKADKYGFSNLNWISFTRLAPYRAFQNTWPIWPTQGEK